MFILWGINMERDFKGVWIPKEIWLNENLSMVDKVIYTEICSLDNENHCTASNEYFAKFCGVSEATVKRSIQTLKNFNLIEQVSFNGRNRQLKMSRQPAQNELADGAICTTINIDNNTSNKDKLNNKLFSTPNFYNEEKPKSKKKNQYATCKEYIMQYTNNVVLQDALDRFLRLLLEKKNNDSNFKFWTNQWPSIVNELDNIASNTDEAVKIVNRSIQNQWNKFYPLSNKSTVKYNPTEKGVTSQHETEEEYNKRMASAEKRKKAGEQAVF